jgi:hypothetical protein
MQEGLQLPELLVKIKVLREAGVRVKDRLGDQRGGSEWELIKILLEGD